MPSETVTDLSRGIYRRLYSGFITGQRITRLSLPAEAWFWRVLVSVDDFGNGRADPELCRAATAGSRKVTVKQIEGWLVEMGEAGLIEFYTVKGERLLHVVGFEENQPAGKSRRRFKRFPLQNDPSAVSTYFSGRRDTFRAVSASEITNDPEITNNSETDTTSRSTAAQVKLVFDFWKEHLKHPKSALDSKRRKAINARLHDGYSVDDLHAAIRGCALTPHNMGENDRKQAYDDIELICRDASHVERFIATATVENGQQQRTQTIREKLGIADDEVRAITPK